MAEGRKLREGTKFDTGEEKLRWDLLPADAMEEIVRVYTIGAKKYEDRNWELGIKYSRILGALKRHIQKFERGEAWDPDGQHHLSSVAWNAIALLTYELRGMTDFDDRPRIQFYPQFREDITKSGPERILDQPANGGGPDGISADSVPQGRVG